MRVVDLSMKFFRPPNFFKLFEQFQKLVAFLLPIFRNVDGSWRVTSKLRDSTLIQVARKRLKVFIRFSASLVRVGDVQGVSRRHAVRGKKKHRCFFGGGVIFDALRTGVRVIFDPRPRPDELRSLLLEIKKKVTDSITLI